jgi:hypothetical protein
MAKKSLQMLHSLQGCPGGGPFSMDVNGMEYDKYPNFDSSHPEPFQCTFRLRSKHAEELISSSVAAATD